MTDIQIIARQAAANTFPPDFRDITEADLDHAADAVADVVGEEIEARFSELIATELEHDAQKIAKSVLRKALGDKIAERSKCL